MSEQINKVLADRPQSFDSAQQAQARDNIGAMAASASANFGLTSVSANAPVTGNGTSGSPLGLSSRVTLASAGAMNDMTPLYQQFTAAGLSSLHQAGYSDYEQAHYTSWQDPQKVIFKTDSGAQEQVDYSSIQRWNSYSAGTPVTTNNCISGDGTSGTPLGISSTVRIESSNSAASLSRRGVTVTIDGSRTAWYYAAFANFEDGNGWTSNYRADYADYNNGTSSGRVDASSIYRWNHPQYYCITPDVSTGNVYLTQADYPTGITGDARLDICPFGSTAHPEYCVNYEAGNYGGTADLYPSANQYDYPWMRSATLWWDSANNEWNDMRNRP